MSELYNPPTEKEKIVSEVRALLQETFEQYKDRGMQAIYLWGSVTRDDFNPQISDIDAMAIIDRNMDLDQRPLIKTRLNQQFSQNMKLGLQFYGIEELNGGDSYTVLSRYQPAGYLLLRFEEWQHIAGQQFDRKDFAVENFTPQEAYRHQLQQSKRALEIVAGERPIDNDRNGLESMCEDVVKGAIGALYWDAVNRGYEGGLNYDSLRTIVNEHFETLAERLVDIRERNAYSPEEVLALKPDINALPSGLTDNLREN